MQAVLPTRPSVHWIALLAAVLSGSLSDCDVTSTYMARWSWDLAIYMAYAEIKVYVQGRPAGDAVYDATGGSGSFDKFIDAEPKIRELVAALFPSR